MDLQQPSQPLSVPSDTSPGHPPARQQRVERARRSHRSYNSDHMRTDPGYNHRSHHSPDARSRTTDTTSRNLDGRSRRNALLLAAGLRQELL